MGLLSGEKNAGSDRLETIIEYSIKGTPNVKYAIVERHRML